MKTKVVVLGVTGMIGNSIFNVLSSNPDLEVYGTLRSEDNLKYFSNSSNLVTNIEIENEESWRNFLSDFCPNEIINCIGVTKHINEQLSPETSININSIFPHKLAAFSCDLSSRLIHISTDCVYSGKKSNYCEKDLPDADDLYGISKHLGEIDYSGHLTLRTSTIGHELYNKNGLLEWFLSQNKFCYGYKKAMFSGLPSTEFANIIQKFVLTKNNLSGLYHVGSNPISKFDLLSLINQYYSKEIEIKIDESFVIDRTLDNMRFQKATGYVASSWKSMIKDMALNRKET